MPNSIFDGTVAGADEAGWADVPSLSTNAPALGGSDGQGPVNAPARALALRTNLLQKDIVKANESISAISTGTKPFNTKAELDAYIPPSPAPMTQVLKDPNLSLNGNYIWDGTKWAATDLGVLAQAKKLDESVLEKATSYINKSISHESIDSNNPVIAAIYSNSSESYAPLMSANGRTLTSNASGDVLEVSGRGEMLANTVAFGGLIKGERPQRILLDADGRIIDVMTMEGSHFIATEAGLQRANDRTTSPPFLGLINGKIAYKVITDASDRIIEAWTVDGRYYIGSDEDGLVLANDRTSSQPFSGLIQGERPYKVVLDADGKIAEAWTTEGSYFIASEQGLVKIGSETKQAKTFRYLTSNAINLYGDETRIGIIIGNICYILIVLGQSNAFGSSNGGNETQPPGFDPYLLEDIVANVAKYPNNSYMFTNPAPRRTNATSIKTIVPLIEARVAGGGSETVCSGWATHLIRDVETATAQRIRTLSFVCAMGSSKLSALKRGTDIYNNYLQALDDTVEVCKANGWTPVVLAHAWIQGETDNEYTTNLTVNARKRAIQQLNRDLIADVKSRTGQIYTPIFFDSQIASAVNTLTTDGPFKQHTKQASVDNDGIENIRCPGPFYQFPTSGHANNEIHANNTGQNRLGQMIARATVNECFGTGSRVLKPIGYRWIDSTNLLLEFDPMVAPLVLDTSGDIITVDGLGAGLGFWFDDYAGTAPTITNASVVSSTFIQLTISAPPTKKKCRLAYAMRATKAPHAANLKGPYGPIYGPRGCLRDSAAHINAYDNSVQHNYCAAFTMAIDYLI